MSLLKVETALAAAVEAAVSGIPTDWPNLPFTKPTDAKWALVRFVPNQSEVETLGADGFDHVDGFVQVDMNYPQSTGTADANADFEKIRSAFPGGASYTYNGQSVRIRNCWRSQGALVDQYYRVSITIAWWAEIPR